MKNFLLTFSMFLLTFSMNAQCSGLSAGDIAFVGFNVDDNDNLAFITFVDIPNDANIYFTDNEWNGSAVGSGGAWNDTNEGFITWTNDTGSDILAGSVIVLDNLVATESTDCGDVSVTGSFNMGGSNEVVYAFCGTSTTAPITFLAALGNDEFLSANGTLTGTGLTAGTNAIAIDGDEDIGVFNGPITVSTTAADINNPVNWTTQDGTGSQANDGIAPDWPADVPDGTAACNLALSVSLTYLEAKPTEQKSVNLHWQTASEENNDYFSIEHSIDGTSFREIGTKVGNGTTDQVQNYSYLHQEVENGLHYYRLKQVDFDGKFEYTNIVTAKISRSGDDIFLTPNPTSNVILIQTKTPYQRDADFQILNMQGQVVLSSILQEGDTDMELNIADFPVGIYYLQLFVDNDVMMKKIIKQ